MNSKALKSSTVLIAGATSQVGQAIASEFADEGSSLVLTGRNTDKLSGFKNAKVAALDFSGTETLEEGLRGLVDLTDKIDHIVFTIAPPAQPVNVKDDAFIPELQTHLDVSVLGFTKLYQAVADKVEPPASITVVLTEYVIGAPPEKMAAYVVAKTALESLVHSMALEIGPSGVRCNAVAPGMINTPYSAGVPVRLKQIEEARNPLRRLCTPEDVAAAVKFLASPEAAFINGITMPVNGGSRIG